MTCHNCNKCESNCSCHSSYDYPSSCESVLNPCAVSNVYRACQEDNSKTYNYTNLVGSIKSESTQRSMPACGATTSINFPNVTRLAVDSMIWASGIGYLTIESFDANTHTAVVKNDCVDCDGQAAPGTTIPGCTEFVVTAPPCDQSGGGGIPSIYPYLAAQFTAQNSGVCIPITVTTAAGLSVGKNVQISGGTYEVSAITSDTNITICNNGAGVTPGVVVEAFDENDNYITPVVLIDPNPCTNDPVTSGKMIVCKDGSQYPLVGVENNQIPVFNLETGEVNFRTINISLGDCTSLTVCLTLDPELPVGTNYLVTVASTAIFLAGDIITISGVIFTVDSIVSATEMRIIPLDHPTAVESYGPGSAVCEANCCTELDLRITTLEEEVAELMPILDAPCTIELQQKQAIATVAEVDADTVLIPKNDSALGSVVTVTVANTSTCRSIYLMAVTTWEWSGNLRSTSGAADIGVVRFTSNYGDLGQAIGAGGSPVLGAIANSEASMYLPNDTISYPTDYNHSKVETYTLLPGTELVISAQAVTAVPTESSDDTRYAVNNRRVRIGLIGVAID